jgi:DNA-binding NtrC family response regulator
VRTLLPKSAHDCEIAGSGLASLPYMEAKERAIEQFSKAYLQAKLAQHDGVITKAAESSGIPRQHFSLLMNRFLGSDSSNED